jgi:3-hydroxyisobutyrate dehydrogenase-like beta-hydroxyacid dehydrogenase
MDGAPGIFLRRSIHLKVAFIGLGNMGEPMALNLVRAGHELTVYNRTRGKTDRLAKEGARVADSPAAAVRGAEVAITMLANDQAVRDAMLVPAQQAAARGQGYVAAPVLGRPDSAAQKKLWIVAAGPPDKVERCRPLMEAMGRAVTVMGEQAWRANLTKIAVNFMLASMLEAMGEAIALMRKSGVDAQLFLEVLNGLFNSPVYANYGKIIAEQRFEPAGFKLRLGLKDVGLALEAAHDNAVPMPLASLLRDHYLNAIAHGRGDADWAALAEVAAHDAGL